jgi:molecular chaperone HtpG
VIDSNDLPLNVSREILQESKVVEAIRVGCGQARAWSLPDELAETIRTSTPRFWKEFGRVFKEGSARITPNRERVAKLCRFSSTPHRFRRAESSRLLNTSHA